ncbi:NAD(P)-binding protein [Ceratobasidium sp. AG-I]|nr:NAD(P)-binding protein [Ceratobasidium sp. AG-I]
MPYSGKAHGRLVASILASISEISSKLHTFLAHFYPSISLPSIDLHGQFAIVTGANSGIGFEIARALVGLGAHVVLACRSELKGEEAMRRIIDLTGSRSVEVEVLDCSSFRSVKAFLERWEKRELSQINILVNNASNTVSVTEDGFEQTYQSNYLSHVLLTHTLLNQGRFVHDARIVSVSSFGFYESVHLDEHNVDCSDILAKYNNQLGTPLLFQDSFQLYARTKASQVIWTMALQRRLSRTEGWKNISAHSCHPGKSPLWNQPAGAGSTTGFLAATFKNVAHMFGISSEQGAVVPVWVAVALEPASFELRGMYWDRMQWKWVKPWTLEIERQDRLWDKWCGDSQASLR